VDNLKEIVLEAMSAYARKGLNSSSYLTRSDDETILSVVTVPVAKAPSFLSLLVRVVGDVVIIERDQNDKPLVDALVQMGVLRAQIVLTYAGEIAPELTP
jgi:hypothetical protein